MGVVVVVVHGIARGGCGGWRCGGGLIEVVLGVVGCLVVVVVVVVRDGQLLFKQKFDY